MCGTSYQRQVELGRTSKGNDGAPIRMSASSMSRALPSSIAMPNVPLIRDPYGLSCSPERKPTTHFPSPPSTVTMASPGLPIRNDQDIDWMKDWSREGKEKKAQSVKEMEFTVFRSLKEDAEQVEDKQVGAFPVATKRSWCETNESSSPSSCSFSENACNTEPGEWQLDEVTQESAGQDVRFPEKTLKRSYSDFPSSSSSSSHSKDESSTLASGRTDCADQEQVSRLSPRTGTSPTSISVSNVCAPDASDERYMLKSFASLCGARGALEFGVVMTGHLQRAETVKPFPKKRRRNDVNKTKHRLSSLDRLTSIKSGLPANAMYRDAQFLKFAFPDTFWAPNIEELHHLRAGMRVMISISSMPKTQSSTKPVPKQAGVSFTAGAGAYGPRKIERFWVRVLDTATKESAGSDGSSKRRTFVAATTESDLSKFLLRAGSMIIFESRNILNVDDVTKRQLEAQFVKEMQKQERCDDVIGSSPLVENCCKPSDKTKSPPIETESASSDFDSCCVENEEAYWKQRLGFL